MSAWTKRKVAYVENRSSGQFLVRPLSISEEDDRFEVDLHTGAIRLYRHTKVADAASFCGTRPTLALVSERKLRKTTLRSIRKLAGALSSLEAR